MNKEQFLTALRESLSGMSPENLQDAMSYYEEYFADAGADHEADVITELGSPQKLAAQIRVDLTLRNIKQKPPTARNGISAVWIVLLAIFAAPIALPILIGIAALAFALFVIVAAVIFGLLVTVVALIASGVVIAVSSFSLLFHNFFAGIMLLGGGLAVTGLSLLVAVLMVLCARWGFHGIARILDCIRKKGGKRI